MQADGQCLAIPAHHFQAREPQVVQVTPGGSEIQLKACKGRRVACEPQGFRRRYLRWTREEE